MTKLIKYQKNNKTPLIKNKITQDYGIPNHKKIKHKDNRNLSC